MYDSLRMDEGRTSGVGSSKLIMDGVHVPDGGPALGGPREMVRPRMFWLALLNIRLVIAVGPHGAFVAVCGFVVVGVDVDAKADVLLVDICGLPPF
jgi:phage terminase large subunit-like protein